ncbi:DELLA protein GAI-like [Solanum verrucosum]|uniref:DELLA protein GAI-like n=1 Tax=Solanum verrucosum TaxID=315347 RepID=UPI0020D14995|nr:DELLA protein GAI-like [Solanum verrucosum]
MSSREMSMDTIMEDEDSFVSNTDAIIYASSDISGWTHSLISDHNISKSSSSTNVDEHHQQQEILTAAGGSDGDDDSMIVSSSASSTWFNNNKQIDDQQEIRIFNVDFRALCNNTCRRSELPGGLLPDTDKTVNEESSVRLVNTLMACAEAIQENNLSLADELTSVLRRIAVSQIGGAMKKVATYFAEALSHKIHRTNPRDIVESSYSKDQLLHMSFYESCLFVKFAHFTANQSILEAFADSKRVHVIDFSLNQGSQWPALLQALTLRPGGPPAFRLTGIGGHSQPDDTTDALQEVGGKLAQLAESMGIEFEFRGLVVHTLADLEAPMLNIRLSNVESVAVNSVFKLHRVFSIPGAIEKVMDLIKQIDPKIVTIAEREVNHNESVFMNRIKEAWHYYSTMFDLLENSEWTKCSTIDLEIAAQHLGREIYNLVACEGTKRVMRHETFGQWRVRFNSAGFNLVPLGSNTSRHANMLLALYTNGKRYRVEEKDGCLMLSWNSRPLITTSAWRGYFAKSKD